MVLASLWSSGLYAGGPGSTMKIAFNANNPSFTKTARMNSHSSPQSYPGQGIFLDLSPTYSRIYNKTIFDDDLWNANGGMGYALDFGYFIRINRYVGLNIALGISNYQAEIGFDSYTRTYSTVDIDNDEVDKTIEVSNLSQKTKLLNVDFPVFIELGNPNTHNISYYVRLGVKFSIPLSYEFTSSGNTTMDGYYPDYFVLLYDIPELGFESNKSVVIADETKLSSFTISAFASAGVTIPVSDYIILKIGATLNYGLSEISDEKLSADDISFFTGTCNSLLMAPEGKTVVQSAGLEVGIIYILQSKF